MMEEFGDKDAILPAPHYTITETNQVSRVLKFFVMGFSLLFWIFGALFCAIGGYVTSQTVGFHEVTYFAVAPGIIVALLGFLIFVMSSFGVLGSLRENIRLLNIYRIFFVGILFFEVFCGFVALAFWPEIKKVVDRSISLGIEQYTSNHALRDMMDTLQRELHCCGSLTVDDWDSNPYFSCKNIESYKACGVPWSCCLNKYFRNRQCGYGVRGANRNHRSLTEDIYTTGCMDKSFEFFKGNMKLISGLAIAFSIPLIFGIFLIRIFMKQIQRQIAVHKDREAIDFDGDNGNM